MKRNNSKTETEHHNLDYLAPVQYAQRKIIKHRSSPGFFQVQGILQRQAIETMAINEAKLSENGGQW